VYGLGIAIIGYYRTGVSQRERAAFGVSAVLLSVPGMLLLPAGAALALLGVDMVLFTQTGDLLLRLVGAVLFAALVGQNIRRSRRETETDEQTGADGAAVAEPS
jgi:membrane protein implicated in regulation of membrane protease activity